MTGYEAESRNVYLGEEAIEESGETCLEFVPDGIKTKLGIPEENFRLWDWNITIVLGKEFDYYDVYLFTMNQWTAILDEAEKLLAFSTFDDLFDYMGKIVLPESEKGDNVFLRLLNLLGERFWDDRDDYKRQLKDLQSWSRLVMPDKGMMYLYGN